jgi:hypothetical protein
MTSIFCSDILYNEPFLGTLKIYIGPIRTKRKRRDSSVGIATGYGLDDWGSGVRFSPGAGNLSLLHRVQTGSGVHAASYPMGTG